MLVCTHMHTHRHTCVYACLCSFVIISLESFPSRACGSDELQKKNLFCSIFSKIGKTFQDISLRVLERLIYLVVGDLEECWSAPSLFVLRECRTEGQCSLHTGLGWAWCARQQCWQAARWGRCFWRCPYTHLIPVTRDEMKQSTGRLFPIPVSLYHSSKRIFSPLAHEVHPF